MNSCIYICQLLFLISCTEFRYVFCLSSIGKYSCSRKHFEQVRLCQKYNNLLLAVDMGLNAGFAIYDTNGMLVHYSYHRFSSLQTLRNEIFPILQNMGSILCSKIDCSVGEDQSWYSANKALDTPICSVEFNHVVLEGDNIFASIWMDAISHAPEYFNREVKFHTIRAHDWRNLLLLKSERATGASAKHSSRLICRQIISVSEFLRRNSTGTSMNTDAAEAILIGYFGVIKLAAWVHFKPLIQRYQNGNIILPK